MKQQENIRELLIRLKESDSCAFSEIFRMYHKHVYLFCCKSLSKEDAEDIVQNVFMVVWENRKKIDLQYSFSAWLFSIARHQVYNAIRDKVIQKSFEEKFLLMTEEAEMPQDFEDSKEQLLTKMEETIETFPPRQREIFKASRFQQMTYKEIALKFGISENTVDTSIRRSLAVLRKTLKQLVILFLGI